MRCTTAQSSADFYHHFITIGSIRRSDVDSLLAAWRDSSADKNTSQATDEFPIITLKMK